jgi:hypothetical protein
MHGGPAYLSELNIQNLLLHPLVLPKTISVIESTKIESKPSSLSKPTESE